MIPKKIHYCWFSGDAFPEKISKCIDSWKKFLPDYELVLWDKAKAESTGLPWVNESLQQKKWAFAADAVRLYALFNEGGIYLDSDVEVLKPFDNLLNRSQFLCYENGSKRIEGAVMGAEPASPIMERFLRFYQEHHFEYRENAVDELVLPNILALELQDFDKTNHTQTEVFSEDYFSPKSFLDGKIRASQNTYCIHHFDSGWRPESLRKSIALRQKLYATLPAPLAKILSIPLSLAINIKMLGCMGTIKKLFKKITA